MEGKENGGFSSLWLRQFHFFTLGAPLEEA